MRVIHIVHGRVNPNGHNGISRVVYHLNKQEKALGVDSEIWAVVDDARTHYTHRRDEHVTVECFPRVRMPFGRHEIIDRLLAEKDCIDLVHFHMIWFYDKNIIAKALNRAGIPFIITTHGTYSNPHALTGKRRLAKPIYELDYLKRATEVHILTREEGTGLQAYGYDGPVFVVPNGICPEEIPTERNGGFFDHKPYRDRIIAIWVGVLRDDKNIKSLIRAMAQARLEIRNGLTVVMVGPDYSGNMEKYRAMAMSIGVDENFDFVGPLYGSQKFDAIQSADFYVMPSHREGMSLAVLDALACAKPSVMTMGCGFNYYLDKDFFVPCEPYAHDLANGINQIVERRGEWKEMGERAQDLVHTTFNWNAVAQEMVRNYHRVGGRCHDMD